MLRPLKFGEGRRAACNLGAGESGVGAAYLAQQQGYDVFVSDFGEIAGKYKDQLLKWNISFEENNIQKRKF